MPPLRIGVIVSQTGPDVLRQYAQPIIDGVRIAADEHTRNGGHRIDVVVRNDSGKATAAASIMREMDAGGVIGVIGPLFEAGVKSAAAARTTDDIVIVSPMLNAPVAYARTFALNREDSAGAVLLGRYAASLGRRVGVLHDGAGMHATDAAAFSRACVAAGCAAPVDVAYKPGTTTFAAHIRRLRDARVQVLFLPLSARDIQQVLPQLGYYGLDGVQVLGGEAWTNDALRRALPAALTEGLIASTVLPRNNPSVGWSDFETAYQQTYRRSLASPIPALGYDAARLLLRDVPRGRVTRGDVARNMARIGEMKGATGILRTAPGAISRKPFLVRLRSGVWEPVVFTGDS
jgi:ABC-type branched-subunit amino acid transport system substrate-binding protein